MREKNVFRFKEFSIRHDQCTMKVGTDGVLLGAWAAVKQARRILDIGTGCGVIALMLAQRTTSDAHIDAVEILEADASQAEQNRITSPWKDKITVHNKPIQQFTENRKYDLIISNPPYFINSTKPPLEKRHQARHTISLSHFALLETNQRFLSQEGTFNVILPYTEGLEFLNKAIANGLFCTRQFSFRGRKEKPVERWLLEFSYQSKTCEQGEIILYNENNEWSDDYRKITQDFYLSA